MELNEVECVVHVPVTPVKIYSFHVAQLSFPDPVEAETFVSLCSEAHRMGECAQSLSPVSLRTPSSTLDLLSFDAR